MTSLREIRQLLEESDPEGWNRISAWGSGDVPVTYPLVDLLNSDDHGAVTKWAIRDYSDLLINVDDVNLSIAYGVEPAYEHERAQRHFSWADERDWDVYVRIADIRWAGQLVDRLAYWSIDGGRAEVAVGDSTGASDVGWIVERWREAVMLAIAAQHGSTSMRAMYLHTIGVTVV